MKKYTINEIHTAYNKALEKGPSDETRNICILDLEYSYYYALDIDRQRSRDIEHAIKNSCACYSFYRQILLYGRNEEFWWSFYVVSLLDGKFVSILNPMTDFNSMLSPYSLYIIFYPINLFRNEII